MTSKPRAGRPVDKVLRELGAKDKPWDVDKHLAGCLNAYNQNPSYGTAVYFALEAISGIGCEGMWRANSKELPQELKDPEWGLAPTQGIPVPWLWVRTLTEAWERYKAGEGLGKAFGQEGGQGNSSINKKLDTELDQRAIAIWIWHRVQEEGITITDAISAAANHFKKSDERIRKIWEMYGRSAKHISN